MHTFSMSLTELFIGPLQELPKEADIQNALGSLINPQSLPVTVVYAPRGLLLQDPIAIQVSEKESHLCVILEEGAEVSISEQFTSTSDSLARQVEIIAYDDAVCTFLSFQNSSSKQVTISQRSLTGANAKVYWQNITLGGSKVTHDLVSRVSGDRGRSDIDWVFYGTQKDIQSLSATNVFEGNEGGGEIFLKGVAEDTAHVQCNGMINIGLQGGGTDTYLTEDVLMLDPTARVDAIPGLEIKTNDVKASHSATVSRVTEEDLFYFLARGIPVKEARRMFVEGFLGDMTAKIASLDMRQAVVEAVDRKYQS